MLHLKELQVEGFRGFPTKSNPFELTTPGVLLLGDNHQGKSSVLNAIEWCLYGDQCAGQKSGIRERVGGWDTVNRNVPKASVKLVIKTDEGVTTINRVEVKGKGRRGRTVEVELPDGSIKKGDDAQQEIVRLIRLSFKDFATTVYQHQETIRAIIVQTASERSDAIDRLLGLSDYRNFLDGIKRSKIADVQKELADQFKNFQTRVEQTMKIRQEELEHEARVKKYTEDLIAYARGEIEHLDIIPSVEPWSDEKIREDTERIINSPTRLDLMRAFCQFVNSESHALVQFASYPGFVLQQAYNSASSGPVANAAETIVNAGVDAVLLLRHSNQRPDYNPHPALVRTLEGHTGWVISVSVTPDGKRAVSGSDDKTVRLWDLQNGECLKTLKGHTYAVNSVSITPDGKKAVSGSNDKTLRVWNLESGKCVRTLKGHTDPVNSVSVTPDGKKAVSGSDDKTLRVWDLESGKCLRTLKGHTDPVDSVSITPDGKRAASGSWDGTLRVWNLEKQEWPIKLNVGGVGSVSITPDGKMAVSASGQTLRLCDLKSAEHLVELAGRHEIGLRLEALKGHEDNVQEVSVTPDGKIAISGGGPYDPTVRVWDLETGKCFRTLRGHTDRVYHATITPDGKKAISAGLDRTLRLWEVESGDCIAAYQAEGLVFPSPHIRPSGYFAATAFVVLHNFPMAPSVVSPVRIWLYGELRHRLFGWKEEKGRWGDDIKAVCQWCGEDFTVSDEILDVIRAIAHDANLSPDQSPCLELPAEAWEEPRLLSECPNCHKPLKFNPFIVDNRE